MIAFYDEDGQYLWVGNIPADGSAHPLEGKYRKYLGDVDPSAQYHDWTNNLPKAMPIRPSIFHQFNYKTKVWFIDRETLLAQVRAKRDKLLAETDWRVIKAMEAGEPMDPAWIHYRQLLREVTDQSDLENVVWPEIPN